MREINLLDLFVKIGVDDQATNEVGEIADKIKGGFSAAAKVTGAAVTAATGAVVALSKNAVGAYAEYEQLVGGVDTLFKESSQKVQDYAANAYKTAGISANEYMNTVTSFSAALIQSLGGDTEKAAETADRALRDMSDKMSVRLKRIERIPAV